MSTRRPVTIPVEPWYKDHGFDGTIVFAAVETMLLLAANAAREQPRLDVRNMEDAKFAKFLEIPPQSQSVEALVECEQRNDGRLRTALLSQVRIGTMRRIKEHGELFFPAETTYPPIPDCPQIPDIAQMAGKSAVTEITAEHIYRHLVPFGPWYHSLQGTLYLGKQGGWGKVKTPALPFNNPIQQVLGSPFALDGAMHAACVLGRQFVDHALFPTGFRQRIIARPTQPGAEYFVTILPVSLTDDEQIFDLGIVDKNGEVFEAVFSLRMQGYKYRG
ncbi:MAG: hypothetical protein ABR512_05360 [Desulfopila sp.]